MRPTRAVAPYIGPLVAVEPGHVIVISPTPELYTNGAWPFMAPAQTDVEAAATSDLVIVDMRTPEVLSILAELDGSPSIVALDGGAALDDVALLQLRHHLMSADMQFVWTSSALHSRAASTIGSTIAEDTIGAPVFCRASIVRNSSVTPPIGLLIELLSSWMREPPDRVHVTSTNDDEYQNIMVHFPSGTSAVCDVVIAPGEQGDDVYLQGTSGGLGWPMPGLTPRCDLIAVAPNEQQPAIETFLRALSVQLAAGMPHGRAALDLAAATAHALSQSRATGATAAVDPIGTAQ